MNVGDKYIIEIAEVIEAGNGMKLGRVKGFDSLVMTEYGLNQLKPYKEQPVKEEKTIPHLGSVIKTVINGETVCGVVTYITPERIEGIATDGEPMAVDAATDKYESIGTVIGAFQHLMASMKIATKEGEK